MNYRKIFIRFAEPVFLGCLANLVINFIFHPNALLFIPEEFLVAIVLAFPITELNRYIDKQLENRIPWKTHPLNRFLLHFLIILLCLVVSLNVFGDVYMWITNQGFFTWKQILIINGVTFCLAILLTFAKWALHFYRQWVEAEGNISLSRKMIDDLKKNLYQSDQRIDVLKGANKIKIDIQSIRLAKIEFGTVRIHSEAGSFSVFPGSLNQLFSLLPAQLFFQVSRDAILNRAIIKSVSSSTFGKISVRLNDNYQEEPDYTVSRPKAAAFRRWYHSTSE